MIFAALLLLQAVSPSQVQHVQQTAPAVRASLEAQLVDYPSARFREVYVTTNPVAEAESGRRGSGYLCGMVNARNRMGGFAGWQRFIAIEGSVMLAGDSTNEIIINGSCVMNGANDGIDRSEWVRHR